MPPFKSTAEKIRPALVRLADLPELLTSKQVRDLLQIAAPRSLRRMIATGRFPKPVTINARVHRWRHADVAKWIEGQQIPEGEPNPLDGWGTYLRTG
jgi:predicted DNA-binding transcriptional regulator AlpA